MISCGEASGDVYAGALVHALRESRPAIEIFGFGGQQLAASGTRLEADYRDYHVTGLVEVVRQLPKTYRLYRRLVDVARAQRPDVLVVIDFPDFNFRLGQAVRALGIAVVYYISPQLWAWRAGRIDTMRRFVSRVLPIFPFEPAIYERAGIPVTFVGHPLIDLIPPAPDRAAFLAGLGFEGDRRTVALLPGSRPNEVREILPTMLAAAAQVAHEVPGTQFVVARAPRLDTSLLAPVEAARAAGLPIVMVADPTDAVVATSDVAITASGTATVQTALHNTPMVIVYRLNALTYRMGKPFVKVDTYGMVNLIAGRRIVTELIQDDFTAEATAGEAVSLLTDERRRTQMRADLGEVVAKLGGPGASQRAARAVLEVAGARTPGA
jgi:lipid-A-disaccharide synthase